MPVILALLLSASALAAPSGAPLLPSASGARQAAEHGVKELLDEIRSRRDDVDLVVVRELANKRTHEALDALLEAYSLVQSVWVRRGILQGVALYDGVEGEGQRALQFLTDAATTSQDRELRLAAVDLIGRCRTLGKGFLALIVDSDADDEVREEALRQHVANPRDVDMAWYRRLWKPEDDGRHKRSRRRSRDDDQPPPPPPLASLRPIAFGALAASLDPKELFDAARSDPDPEVRVRAIKELAGRKDEHAPDLVESLFDDARTTPEDRLYAAGVLLRERGTKFVDDLVDAATKKAQSETFTLGAADLIEGLGDAAVDKHVARKVGHGKGLEKIFWMRAARGIKDEDLGPKLDAAYVKAIGDRDPEVVLAALAIVSERRVHDALPALEKLMAKSGSPQLLAAAMRCETVLQGDDPGWVKRLVDLTSSDQRLPRNAAVTALGSIDDPRLVEPLVAALSNPDWSTRLAAVHALLEMRRPDAVGPLIERLGKETGRLEIEVSDALWQLTGQPFRRNAQLWEKWWEGAKDGFQVVSAEDLRHIRQDQEEHRLREVTRSTFFGLKVESERVVFILDISGSMNERTHGRYVDAQGAPRIDVAKRELTRCLASLDDHAFFNLIVFSGGVQAWHDAITENGDAVQGEAQEFVSRLGAGGGTNLFGALSAAFQDPEVDTIYVLSDGEPTVGDVIDPGGIRRIVREWNQDRGVVIDTIAVGGSLQVLQWLAADSGGTYVRFP